MEHKGRNSLIMQQKYSVLRYPAKKVAAIDDTDHPLNLTFAAWT
jgi:hypothetical protein